MISRLHYISQAIDGKDHLQNIQEACKAGVDWVQLRIKDQPLDEIERIAAEARTICKKAGARLIINDHVEIAKAVKANGVHLGKNDMDPAEARKILGERPYIGGTANTWEDVLKLHLLGVDYIGLGPFKFTDTKENLSPVLGLKGYSSILNNMIINEMETPIIAIGGIGLEDVFELQMTGIHGVAVASLINTAEDKKSVVGEINQLLLNDDFIDDEEEDFDDGLSDDLDITDEYDDLNY